jgi:hypothetical protein
MTDASPAWLDEIDQAILDHVRDVHTRIDPPPAGLDERVQFAIALTDADAEVARLRDEVLIGSGARGTERTRSITFDSESLTIMVAVVERPGGLVRLDGWLAPEGRRRVELRTADTDPGVTRVVTANEAGRFVFDGVAHGLAQLLVHLPTDDGAGTSVITPPLVL